MFVEILLSREANEVQVGKLPEGEQSRVRP